MLADEVHRLIEDAQVKTRAVQDVVRCRACKERGRCRHDQARNAEAALATHRAIHTGDGTGLQLAHPECATEHNHIELGKDASSAESLVPQEFPTISPGPCTRNNITRSDRRAASAAYANWPPTRPVTHPSHFRP